MPKSARGKGSVDTGLSEKIEGADELDAIKMIDN